MPRQIESDFAIQIDFRKESEDPGRVFRTATSLIESLQRLDRELVHSIDINIEPVLLLEDIESGSLKIWLRSFLKSVDDSALKSGDWKKLVGSYLVKAKYAVVNWCEGRTTITNRAEVKQLEMQLVRLAEETNVRQIPVYEQIRTPKLLRGIQDITESIALLSEGDAAKLITEKGETGFNMRLDIVPESLHDILVKEIIGNNLTVILKVRKPDYLGQTMWEFRHEDRFIEARIEDAEWLARFQGRKIDVRPQDSVRARVRVEVHYGHDGEVIRTDYRVLEVLEVIPYEPAEERGLF